MLSLAGSEMQKLLIAVIHKTILRCDTDVLTLTTVYFTVYSFIIPSLPAMSMHVSCSAYSMYPACKLCKNLYRKNNSYAPQIV